MLTYDSLEESYGHDIVKTLKNYETTTRKIVKLKNRRIYLLRCKTEDVTPNFLKLKLSHVCFQNVNLERRYQKHILPKFKFNLINMLITDTTITLKELNHNAKKTKNELTLKAPTAIINQFFDQISEKNEYLFKKIKLKNQKKFNNLLTKNSEATPKKWVENLTNLDIPDFANEILSLGPNYATKINNEKELPITNIICNIENGLNSLTNTEKDTLRAKTCNIITNFKNKLKNCEKKSKIDLKLKKTKSFLKNNPNIRVLRADKTNKTVIMSATDYDTKMNNLLNDKKTYKQVKMDPTNQLQKKNNELVKLWEQKNYISPTVAKKLQIRNAVPPKIYGLPKLHKKDIPLRPIVSGIQSPLEPMSKFLKNILNNIINKNNYYIKDSTDFKNKIKDTKIPINYSLISLDVISLYTNVPISLATKIIDKKWSSIKRYTDIPQDDFVRAVELTLTSTYFAYEDKIFKQIDGCAMGASISSVVAQLVLEDLEETILAKMNFDIPLFYRYVDDCILAVPKTEANNVLNQFNSYHKKLQFTIEMAEGEKINFLDLTLHLKNNSIRTEWYTKQTWSSRYLNFNSCHPICQKKSVVIGLADRVIRLSDPEYRKDSIQKAKNALVQNNYPQKLVNKIFGNRINKHYNSLKYKNQSLNSKNKKTNYLSLPYIEGLSHQFQKLFKEYNIDVCHKGHNLLAGNFSKLKTTTPKNKRSNIVYKIPCNDCEGAYIGQTSQYLENRIKSHKYDKKNATALSNHESKNNHSFNYNEVIILASEVNTKKREFLEMVEIKKEQNSINDKKDVCGLSKLYFNILV